MKPNFVKQTDYRYRNLNYHGMTMGAGGCGVMSVYNAVSSLTKPHITPKQVWKYMTGKGYVIAGQGTAWDGITKSLKHYGINPKVTYSDAEVKKALEDGKWVFALCGRSRWTSSGHYVIIYKLTKTKHLLISDPYSSSDYCQKNGTLSEYLACNKCNWIIDPKKYKGAKKPKTTKTYTLYVDSVLANVRADRNTKKKALGTLPRGTQLTLHNYKNGWYQIKKGRFKGKYIGEKTLTNLPPYKHTFKALSMRSVRNGATTKADVIGKVVKGKAVISSKRLGDWIYVPAEKGWIRYKGKRGTYLEKV